MRATLSNQDIKDLSKANLYIVKASKINGQTTTHPKQDSSNLSPLTIDQANDYFDYIDCGLVNLSGYLKHDSEFQEYLTDLRSALRVLWDEHINLLNP